MKLRMTPQELFVLYLCALQDYEASEGDMREMFKRNTEIGFCFYFHTLFSRYYEAVDAVQPLKKHIRNPDKPNSEFWFSEEGATPARINCLKKAINELIEKHGESLFS